MSSSSAFTRLAKAAANFTGRPACFGLALGIVIVWALCGPIFKFSDTWQLVINTGTTIITFLMVFLIQNTQNRDTEAMHIKLDELIHVTRRANNELLDLEEMEEKELDRLRKHYEEMAQKAKQMRESRGARRDERDVDGRDK